MSRSTLSIQDETKQEFDELKPESSSQDEFLRELLDAYETMQDTELPEDGYEFAPSPSNPDPDSTEDRTGEILGRLDDLEASLPEKTASELEHRFR